MPHASAHGKRRSEITDLANAGRRRAREKPGRSARGAAACA
jgi:hypothetical protein